MNQNTGAWLEGLSKNRMFELTGDCHDCKGRVSILVERESGGLFVSGGMVWKFADIDKPFFKCADCFHKRPLLMNYRECEVWSRVVGYLAPTRRWNKGKLAENAMRTDFKTDDLVA